MRHSHRTAARAAAPPLLLLALLLLCTSPPSLAASGDSADAAAVTPSPWWRLDRVFHRAAVEVTCPGVAVRSVLLKVPSSCPMLTPALLTCRSAWSCSPPGHLPRLLLVERGRCPGASALPLKHAWHFFNM
jgi:hypothetical protein